MVGDLETAKTIATIAAPFTGAIVETWIKPKLQKLVRNLKTDKVIFENALASKFDEYLQRAYQKNLYISVIVFQNRQIKLEDIYLPLTVVQPHRGQKSKIVVDGYEEELIPKHKKVLIKDTAGMGKSTLLKCLFLSCVKQNAGIPVFIELRKLKGADPILSYIYNELNPIDDEFDKDFILKLIKQGDFIFFLDGYDEIPNNQRDEVSQNLQDFIGKAGNNLFILSSRPESSLISFSDFQEFNIQPLKPEEAYELLRKYDTQGELSTGIIAKLKEDTSASVKEFLENPLLVSLLFKSYEYKPTIHVKKHIFYRQVYDALFENHDFTKTGSFIREKHSQLNIEEFHGVLRALGFITVKLGQIEFDKDALLSLLRESKERCPGLDFKESDFLKDLLTTVPLFNRDGNYFKWAHKSIQEYFAAQFIWLDSRGNQSKILRQMVRSHNNERYENVLDLYYDMDYNTFRQTLIYDLICAFLKYYDSTYLRIDRQQISEKDIDKRKILTFGKIYVFTPTDRLSNHQYPPLSHESLRIAISNKKGLIDLEVVVLGENKYIIQSHWTDGLVEYANYTQMLTTLLSDKDEAIFIDKALASSWQIDYEFPKHIKLMQPCVLDDSPDLPYNQKELFVLINNVISDPDFNQYLSPAKCRQLKVEIENELERDSSDDFFTGNI